MMNTGTVSPHVRGLAVVCGCGPIFVPFRCAARSKESCDFCKTSRARQFLAKFFERVELSGVSLDETIMWTLGTSIEYYRDYDWDSGRWVDNISEITCLWQKFNSRMKMEARRNGVSWDPLVYVVEAGSEGNRLHVHLLVRSKINHQVVLQHWRDLTGEKSNVNFVKGQVGYLAKYAGKGLLRYSFLGELYKARPDLVARGCSNCGSNYQLLSTSIYREEIDRLINQL